VRLGGDIAALFGISRALIEADDILQASGESVVAGDATPRPPTNALAIAFSASVAAAERKPILDHDFIREHSTGFQRCAAAALNYPWEELERVSGFSRAQMQVRKATDYARD
jgi:anaerobic selenocysteine-containing dehydrogenase